MTVSEQEMINEHIDNVAETVAEYARQIESGDYGPTIWTVTNADSDDDNHGVHRRTGVRVTR